MGQTISLTARVGAEPDVRIFDLDRSLTGMAIERYDGAHAVHARRPPDVLAARLFDLGAQQVTVYSSAISVQAPVSTWDELQPKVEYAIRHLFEYYGDDAGWSPEALAAEIGDSASGDSGAAATETADPSSAAASSDADASSEAAASA